MGTNVTVADVVEAEHRAHAYSITRMGGHNIGVALGPHPGWICFGEVLQYRLHLGITRAAGLWRYRCYFIKETMPTQNARESLREQFLIYKEALKTCALAG